MVSLAQIWLCHSFTETADLILKYLQTGELDIDNYYPDFPTGGTIVNKNDLSIINKTGRGKVIVEANYRIKNNEIDFYEMPYQVYIEPVIIKIKEEIDAGNLKNVIGVFNKSDKNRISLSIECNKNSDPEDTVKELFSLTPLRSQYNANQNAIVSKTPILLNLQKTVDIYIQHNLECIRKEYQFELNKANDRVEILNGLSKALEDIENIIELIKNSVSAADAQLKLIKKYNFSQRQATAILDMKLSRLANLEKVEVYNELKEKIKYAEDCKNILETEDKQKSILVDRLTALKKKYGDKRHSKVIQKTIVKTQKKKEIIVPEDVVIILTAEGYLKKVPVKNFKVQRRNGTGIKNIDNIIIDAIKTNTVDTLILFSNYGKMFRLIADDIPECGNKDKGAGVGSLISLEPGEKILNLTSVYADTSAQYAIFITKQGMFKKTKLDEYKQTTRNLKGQKATKLKENDSIVNITFINEEPMVLFTNEGHAIKFATNSINPIGKLAVGVKGIATKEDEHVVCGLPIHKESDALGIFYKDGTCKKIALSELRMQTRGGVGVSVGSDVVDALMLDDTDLIFIIGKHKNITVKSSDITVRSKASNGVPIIKNQEILQVVKI